MLPSPPSVGPNTLLRPTIIAGIFWSGMLHAALFSACAGWLFWRGTSDPPSFSGETTVIYAQWTSSPAVATPPPTKAVPYEHLEQEPVEPRPHDSSVVRKDVESSATQPPTELTQETVLMISATPASTRQQAPQSAETMEPTDIKLPKMARQTRENQLTTVVAALPITTGTDDRPPDLSNNPSPPYPEQAWRSGIEGRVLLELRISPSGSIERVTVKRSSGYPILDNSAVEAVKKWKGRPALSAGQAVSSTETLPIIFQLNSRATN